MIKDYLISIVVPIYNVESFLNQCLESIREQDAFDHLCEFVRLAIERNIRGFYHPQDRENINAICLMQSLANAHCLSRPSSYVLGKIVMQFSFLPLIKKIYGGVEYNHNCDGVSENSYNSKNFNENIEAIFK